MYSFDSRVRYSECDEEGVLTPFAMMNYLQDCSTFQSEAVGRGLRVLSENRLGWFVTSWLIRVYDMPRFTEEITVSTWSYDIKSIRASRAFRIGDRSGRTRVIADSQWCMFDFQAGRVTTVGEDDKVYLERTPRPDLPEIPRRLRLGAEGVAATPITVGEQSLDTNRHVNNAEYLRFAIGAVAEVDHAPVPARLDIQYRRMALLGDTIIPVVHREPPSTWAVSLEDEGGSPYAIVRLEARQ